MHILIDSEEWSVAIENSDSGTRARVYLMLAPKDHDGKIAASPNSIQIGFLKTESNAKMLARLAEQIRH